MIETTFSQLRPISIEIYDKFPQVSNVNYNNFVRYIESHQNYQTLIKFFSLNFKNQKIFNQAFFHASFINEFKGPNIQSNECLEFLGDSVLGAIVAEYLYVNFPNLSEGELSRFRGAIVNEKSWSALGQLINLPTMILLGKGETSSNVASSDAVISDLFEAIFGACFIDSGFDFAQKLFHNILRFYKDTTGKDYIELDLLNSFDAKSRLQELTMKLFKMLPDYQIKQLEDQSFEAILELPQVDKIKATGSSKKQATSNVAKLALEKLLKI